METDELTRLAEEQWTDRRISGSIYCGNCGYNLRTLPYVYTCPECGNEYNARPLKMKGIFVNYDVSLPVSDMAVVLLLAPVAFVLLRGSIRPFAVYSFALGGFAFVLTVIYAGEAYRRTCRWLKVRRLARRIAQSENA